MSTATRTTEEALDTEAVLAEHAALIEKRDEARQKLYARSDRLDELRNLIEKTKREENAAFRQDDFEILPSGDFAERLRELEDELARVKKAHAVAKRKLKNDELTLRKFEGRHFEIFKALLDEEAQEVREEIEALIPEYRKVYGRQQRLIKRQTALLHNREIFLERGANRIGRKPSEVPGQLELTDERALPDPALLEVEPPEIVPKRPRDVMGRPFTPQKRRAA